jgi:hypothetical protein
LGDFCGLILRVARKPKSDVVQFFSLLLQGNELVTQGYWFW